MSQERGDANEKLVKSGERSKSCCKSPSVFAEEGVQEDTRATVSVPSSNAQVRQMAIK